jgi:hypothetical protein
LLTPKAVKPVDEQKFHKRSHPESFVNVAAAPGKIDDSVLQVFASGFCSQGA